MKTYSGICQAGPWGGQALEHWSQRKTLFENRYREVAREIGEYVYSSAGGGCWIWEPRTHDPET